MILPLDAGLEVCERRLSAHGPLAVAFSGGGDSLALLLVARAWAHRCGRPLVALHVDHGLQPQSAAWADRAATMADKLDIPVRVLDWRGDKPASGLPAAARAARHRLIADAARAAGARVILLGHTLDDQLENALMRGAGSPVGALVEWSASPVWPEGRELFHCRPLLAARRAVLRRWLAEEGLRWIEDPANGDARYARARARTALAEGARATAIVPAADVRPLAAACRVSAWGAVEIPRAALRTALEPQGLRLLQLATACASGAEHLARPGRARNLMNRLRGHETFTATLGGARIMAGAEVRLTREVGEAARGGLEPLNLTPATTDVWDGRWQCEGPRGSHIRLLGGLASRLGSEDAAALRDIPASDRRSLPVLRDAEGRVRLAHLASVGYEDHQVEAIGRFRSLVEHRFNAACGMIQREDGIGTNARMANWHPPSYVGVEGKG